MTVLLLDRAPKCSWNAVPFAITSVEIIGEARTKTHEYPHQDGGDVEKLGRKNYIIRVDALFDQGFEKFYPRNYPNGLDAIVSYAENGITAELVLPMAGSIQVMCKRWPRKWKAERRSGEELNLEFEEDQTLIDLDTFAGGPTLDMVSSVYDKLTGLTDLAPEVPKDLLDKLRDAVNSVLILRDQAELQLSLVEAKVLGVEQLISQLDKAITTPLGYPLVNAAILLWNTVDKFANDLTGNRLQLRKYTVPRPMTILDIAAAVYQDTSRAMDILQLNAIDDAFAVPANTVIRYLVDIGQIKIAV